MKIIKPKQFLYTCCFICFVIIDWSRGSQTGWIWAFSVNLTGIFMCILTLSHFSFRKSTYWPYGLWLLIWILGSIGGFYIWGDAFPYGYVYQYWIGALNILCFGIIAIRMWQEKLFAKVACDMGKNPYRLVLIILWILMVLGMTFSPSKERVWPIWYLCMFGFFYMVPFSDEERKQLWKGMAVGIVSGFFILQIYAYGFRPYDVTRYRGAYSNSNAVALFYLVVLVMFLYLLRDMEVRFNQLREMSIKPKFSMRCWLFFYRLMAAGQVCFIFYTIGRTAIALSLLIMLAYGAMTVNSVTVRKRLASLLGKWLTMACFVLITFPLVFLTIRYLPTVLHHPIWYEGEYTVDKVHSFDPYNSDKYVSLPEYLEAAISRFDVGMIANLFWENEKNETFDGDSQIDMTNEAVIEIPSTDIVPVETLSPETSTPETSTPENSTPENSAPENSAPETSSTEIPSTETLPVDAPPTDTLLSDTSPTEAVLTDDREINTSSIRREIYRLYWNGLNLHGHQLEDGYFQITSSFHAWHAQNLFLQMSFYYGIPVGVLCILLTLMLGIRAILCFLRDTKRPEGILPIFLWIVFAGYGMLECVWYPGQLILLLFFLIQKVQVPKQSSEQNQVIKQRGRDV
jgi:hypothetical protein